MSDDFKDLNAAIRKFFADHGITPREPSPYWDLVEPYMGNLKTGSGVEVFIREFRMIPERSACLIATHFCQSEILNGGLHQFFSNSTGILAPSAVKGFRAIRMVGVADMLEKAMEFFPKPYPLERAVRNDVLDRYSREHHEQWHPFRTADALLIDRLCSDDGRCAGRYEEAANRYSQET